MAEGIRDTAYNNESDNDDEMQFVFDKWINEQNLSSKAKVVLEKYGMMTTETLLDDNKFNALIDDDDLSLKDGKSILKAINKLKSTKTAGFCIVYEQEQECYIYLIDI